MAEIIDLTKIIKQREQKNLDELSERLANLIEDLDLSHDFEMFMESEDGVYGMPYVYTMYTPPVSPYIQEKKVKTLSDVTDVLTKLTLQLDGLGYTKWANQISEIVGEMFVSGTFRENR